MPLYKLGEKWDIAMAALYLSCDSGKYVSGLTLVVDAELCLSKPRHLAKEAVKQLSRAVAKKSRAKRMIITMFWCILYKECSIKTKNVFGALPEEKYKSLDSKSADDALEKEDKLRSAFDRVQALDETMVNQKGILAYIEKKKKKKRMATSACVPTMSITWVKSPSNPRRRRGSMLAKDDGNSTVWFVVYPVEKRA
ncbi:hypothetical protein AT1G36580 [Arabidopsis thaliana]|uniref:Uncharacterized protein n=1 Tax=Arabidopsis thaliana TaxID=3702 RepID=F4I386_ARATH|nr:uncharacterized protein AT1G36580 [Arabidopsis thaliana]AEE31867.2 hypothetical protein AT1G36580 [Arabidopsis thaliana]|eukprot:NP_174871.5 hypothetical protein AT1G36580 [Arabidopsis thaliana]